MARTIPSRFFLPIFLGCFGPLVAQQIDIQGAHDYIPYGEWSRCTVSCGGGLSFRVKECDELTGGIDCEKSESRPCNTNSCESEGNHNYIPYGKWSRCTVSCGGGLSFRVKECDELTGGIDCEKSESRPCNTNSCESEGPGNKYDNYSAWSECTVTCGGGYSFRTRECKEFSGEIDCEKSKRRRCNEQACESMLPGARSLQLSFIKPDDNEDQTSLTSSSGTGNKYDNYSAWSECTVTCGGGYSFRTRECKEFSGEIDCEKSKRRRCNDQPCKSILTGARSLQLSFIKPDDDEDQTSLTSSSELLNELMEGQVEGRVIPSRENLIADTTIATIASIPPTTTRTTASAATTTKKSPSTTTTIATTTQVMPVEAETPGARFRKHKTTLPPQTMTEYETASSQPRGKCGGTLLASKNTQTMDSKVFLKNRKYDCVWQISSPKGSTVKARIMYYHTAKCCSAMEVYDSDQLLKKYQGSIFIRGDDFTTTTNNLIVLYSNPAVNGYARVRVFYRVADEQEVVKTTTAVWATKPYSIKPKKPLAEPTKSSILLNDVRMCGHDVRASHYVLQMRSPHFIHGKQYDCTWHIIAPPGRQLQVRLYYHNTAMGGDTLEVKDGSEFIDRISTSTYSQTKYITKGRTLSLRFISQGYSGTRRFYAYYMIQPDMIPAMPVHQRPTSHYYTRW